MQTIQDEANDEPQVMQVRIVNLNTFDIRDMFNGVPFTFLAGGIKPTNIPIDAANHIFGWFPTYKTEDADGNVRIHKPDPVDMKKHIMRRWGWNTPDMVQGDRGQMFYDNIRIDPIMFRMVPVEVDDEGHPLVKNGRAPKVNKLMEAAERALS